MFVRTSRPLLALAAGAGLAFAVGAPADAAKAKAKAKVVSHCTGTKLESRPLTYGGKSRGHAELWYSTKEGGTNCVMTYDDAKGSRMMSASLVVQDSLSSSDTAVYATYAGGAAVTRTNGHCVQWGAYAYFGKKQFMYIDDTWTHCK